MSKYEILNSFLFGMPYEVNHSSYHVFPLKWKDTMEITMEILASRDIKWEKV